MRITILYTTDAHGHISGPGDGRQGGTPGGGLLRCAALVKSIREKEANVLLIDCGDLIQGTAASSLSRGGIMIEAAMAMGYDALVPGNHEFDWGVENLRRLYEQAGIPVLVCNGFSRNGDEPVFENACSFLMRDFEGVRVAIVGLITPHISAWFMPSLVADAAFERSVPALRRTMPLVRAGNPDIIIVAAHQGHREWGGDDAANEINAMAREFPDIDLIIGGHTHQEVVMRDVGGVPYTQAGCYGQRLGRALFVVDAERKVLKSLETDLLRADGSVAPDAELRKMFEEELVQAEEYLNRTVGSARILHSPRPRFPGQSQTQTLISKAIAEAVKADVVIHRSLTDYELRPGVLTMRDVWGIVPFENDIWVVSLTLDELAEILEENSGFLDTREFRGVHGLVYEIHPELPEGSRVRDLRLADGRKPAKSDRIRVALNSYDIASAGGRMRRARAMAERPTCELEETGVETRDAVVDYIKRHSPIEEQAVAGAIVARP